jgi:hypothetical protein
MPCRPPSAPSCGPPGNRTDSLLARTVLCKHLFYTSPAGLSLRLEIRCIAKQIYTWRDPPPPTHISRGIQGLPPFPYRVPCLEGYRLSWERREFTDMEGRRSRPTLRAVPRELTLSDALEALEGAPTPDLAGLPRSALDVRLIASPSSSSSPSKLTPPSLCPTPSPSGSCPPCSCPMRVRSSLWPHPVRPLTGPPRTTRRRLDSNCGPSGIPSASTYVVRLLLLERTAPFKASSLWGRQSGLRLSGQ